MPKVATGGTVAVKGLRELQAALKRGDANTSKQLTRELRELAKGVQRQARSNVEHKTGRHGGPDVPKLAPSIRTSVTRTGATVYSNAPHAAAQDLGARVGKGAILQRSQVSRYMTRAVDESKSEIERGMDRVLDRLGRDFER